MISLTRRVRRVLAFLRDVAWYLLDGVAVSGGFVQRRRSNAVILVRVDAIGDFVLWLDSARALREHFNDRRIVLVANLVCADLAKRCGYFNEVVGVDLMSFIGNPLYRWRVVREVYRLGAAVAIQPTYTRDFLTGDALIRATVAAERIGFVSTVTHHTSWQQFVADHYYTRLIPATATPLMELERNCEFLRGLGLVDARPEVAKLPVMTDLPVSLQLTGNYFIVFPGASMPLRMWPTKSFGLSARSIATSLGWRMVLCGTTAEGALARDVITHAGLTDSIDLTGKTSLAEFVELVRRAQLLIGNETSAVHIAAAVGTPSVCLLGGGHFERFMPYPESVVGMKPIAVFERMACFGCHWHCHWSDKLDRALPCVAAIQVQGVVNAAQKLIRGEDK